MNSKFQRRRIAAKQRLVKQLEIGTKPLKVNGKTTNELISLTDSDINRIKAELSVL
jgi:hypothetical protein